MYRFTIFSTILLLTYVMAQQQSQYIACGSDDETEGPYCCIAKKYQNQSTYFCAAGESSDVRDQCQPDICKSKDIFIKVHNQTQCIETFLGGNKCKTVKYSTCVGYAHRRPKICDLSLNISQNIVK